MKKFYAGGAGLIIIAAGVSLALYRSAARREQLHYDREETEFIVTNLAGGNVSLYQAGSDLAAATPVPLQLEGQWLPRGNYFLKVEQPGQTVFYPAPIFSYRSGPDKNGTFVVTIRPLPAQSPPTLNSRLPQFAFIPSGHFLFGDRLRPSEPHYVWLPAYFISPFEVTNGEFKQFINDPHGYADDRNWSDAGREWKAVNRAHATAQLGPADPDYARFGEPDQPVVQVNWFEANAYCRWLTQKLGGGRWIFA